MKTEIIRDIQNTTRQCVEPFAFTAGEGFFSVTRASQPGSVISRSALFTSSPETLSTFL